MAAPTSLLLASLAILLAAGSAGAGDPPRVLFLTHSAGSRHAVVTRKDSGALSFAETQLKEACRGAFEVEATQDCAAITKENLARFEAVAFYNDYDQLRTQEGPSGSAAPVQRGNRGHGHIRAPLPH